eukprot:Awhi_evm2s7230
MATPDCKVYTPKVVLMTGGAGFIGSAVARHFIAKYSQITVVVIDKLDYCASAKNVDVCRSSPNFHFVEGCITNYALVFATLQAYKVDSIVNFAAQSHVDLSFKNSLIFTQTNVYGTHVLLEASRKHGIQRFVHVSTDEVYGDVALDSATETRSLDPTNPYAFSKAAAELVVKSYIKNFDFPVIITRGNNVYGPCQFPEKVIPKFILRLLNGQKCCLHGEGTASRTYVFVEDVASGFDRVLHYGINHEIYNIGSIEEITMKELAVKLIHLIKGADVNPDDWIEYVEDRIINDQRYSITLEKLSDLGWTSKNDFDIGLSKTIEWYRSMPKNWWPAYEYALAAHPDAHSVQ